MDNGPRPESGETGPGAKHGVKGGNGSGRRAGRGQGPPPSRAGDWVVCLLLTACFTFVALRLFSGTSADLRALWLAAGFFAEGRVDQVYAASGAVYEIVPPSGWLARASAQGAFSELFPYVYPPLWLALVAPLTRLAAFADVEPVARIANCLLIASMAGLAWRLAAVRLSPQAWMAAVLVPLALSPIGATALLANQLQVLVAFLIVLAAERSRSGAPRAAGAALAVAAAIKLYPALFVVLWVARGRRVEALSFVAVGAALALASLAVAGWPLHRDFLNEVAAIGRTVVSTRLSWGLPAQAMQHLWPGAFHPVAMVTVDGTQSASWDVALLPGAGRAAVAASMCLALGAGALLVRRAGDREALVWAAVSGALALLMPLSWAYYYLMPAAFLPVLIERFGTRRGLLSIAALVVPASVLPAVLALPGADAVWVSAATASMAILVAVLAALALGPAAPAGPPKGA